MTGDWSALVAVRFARNLARCRSAAGLSQQELAARAGLSRNHISIMEHGNRAVQIDTLIKLAGGLDVDPVEQLNGMTWKLINKSQRRPSPSGTRSVTKGRG